MFLHTNILEIFSPYSSPLPLKRYYIIFSLPSYGCLTLSSTMESYIIIIGGLCSIFLCTIHRVSVNYGDSLRVWVIWYQDSMFWCLSSQYSYTAREDLFVNTSGEIDEICDFCLILVANAFYGWKKGPICHSAIKTPGSRLTESLAERSMGSEVIETLLGFGSWV